MQRTNRHRLDPRCGVGHELLNLSIIPKILRCSLVLILFEGIPVPPAVAADIEISASSIRLSGVVTGGRAGTSMADGDDLSGAGGSAVVIGAYLAGANDGGVGYVHAAVGAPGVYPLSGADAIVEGNESLDRFGYSISSGGDWNDDGRLDVAFGAWSVDQPLFDSGAVYVFFGGASFSGSFDAADADVVLTGGEELDHFGWALDIGHDVNGDGVSDLVVGAPLAQGTDVSTGAAYIFYGGAGRTSGSTVSRDDADVAFLGSEPESGVGSAIACGNIDGSSPADIAIGAPNRDALGRFNNGVVYLLKGAARASGTVLFESDADRTIVGEGFNDAFGTFVGLELVNDDAEADVVVGAPLAAVMGDGFRGRAYVFDSPSLPGGVIDSQAGTAATRILGSAGGDLFGTSLAVSGDLDGDGFREFVVGAPGVDRPGRAGCGAAFVFMSGGEFPASGSAASADDTYIGTSSDHELGATLLALSDFDGDGRPDLLVGAPGVSNSAGAVYVVSGQGTVDVASTPAPFVLSAPRPNPFERVVTISMPAEAVRAVEVFDMLGRRVRVLKGEANERVTWDGSDDTGTALPAGVYVVRVVTESGTLTQRVTWVR